MLTTLLTALGVVAAAFVTAIASVWVARTTARSNRGAVETTSTVAALEKLFTEQWKLRDALREADERYDALDSRFGQVRVDHEKQLEALRAEQAADKRYIERLLDWIRQHLPDLDPPTRD